MATLADRIDANIEIIEQKTGQKTPPLATSFNRVIATLIAVAESSLDKAAARAARENLVITATRREHGGKLQDIGEQYGVTYGDASAAIISVEFVATAGSSMPAGTAITGDDNGLIYDTTAAASESGGKITATMQARQSGESGNLAEGAAVQLVSSLAGVDNVGEVDGVTTAGADPEDIDAYRTRVLERIRSPGETGNLAFYRRRAKAVAGVANAYPYRGVMTTPITEQGVVTVYIEAETSVSADRIPPATLLTSATSGITYDGTTSRLPLGVTRLDVSAVTVKTIDIEVNDVILSSSYNLDDLKADLTAELTAYCLRLQPYIEGLDYTVDRNDRINDVAVSAAVARVATAYGAAAENAVIRIGGLPKLQYQLIPGELAKLGTLTVTTP